MRPPLAVMGLLALAACAPPAGPRKTLGPFQPTPDYALTMADAGPSVALAYGPPDPAQAKLKASCYKGSGRIMVWDFWDDGARVKVTSGEASQQFNGDAQGGEGGVNFWAHASDAPIAAFRNSGALALVSGKRSLSIAARPDELNAVRGFFASCAKREGAG